MADDSNDPKIGSQSFRQAEDRRATVLVAALLAEDAQPTILPEAKIALPGAESLRPRPESRRS